MKHVLFENTIQSKKFAK